MKKLAFFVEGQTELLFIKKLLTEIAGVKNILIDSKKYIGNSGKKANYQITASSQVTTEKYYVLITDCTNDTRVQSAVIDHYPSLVKEGYSMILGLRDLHPNDYKDLKKVKKGVTYGVPTKPIQPEILLSVMEVEAWFLAEHTHFQKIHSDLTLERIKKDFGIELDKDDIENISKPAELLHLIYSKVGKAYTKRKTNTSRTVNALDYNDIYISLNSRVVHLGYLIDQINKFLS